MVHARSNTLPTTASSWLTCLKGRPQEGAERGGRHDPMGSHRLGGTARSTSVW